MDAANILSSSLPAQPAVSATTTVSEVAITKASVQQPSTTATVSVSQGHVQTDRSQTSQDVVGPTVQLKIMIEQTIVQFLSQLDKLFATPQAVADFLPESIRQDMQQILSNQLLAATPETFEQGLTAMIKMNKDTADAFSQLAKGLNGALTFQDKLPEIVQKFLQTARPLLTELLNQTKSQINPQLGQQPVNQGNGGVQQPTLSTADNLTNRGSNEVTTPISKNPSSTASQLSAVATDDETPVAVTQQLTTDPVVKQEQTLPARNNDKPVLIKPSLIENGKVAAIRESDSQLVSKSTAQTVISNILLLNNNPNVPVGPVGVDEFFNWIAQEFRQNQDKPGLQESLQQKIDVWSAPLSQLSESDSKAFNEIKQQLEQQLPSQLKSIAIELPALKDLYIYNKMSDLAKYADLSQDRLFAAKTSISHLAESFQKSLVDSLSFHSETGSSGKVLTFFMPIAFDGTTTFPAHIHIYHQNQPEKRGGPSVAETWLRIFLKTDYSGTITLLFHVRQQAVNMKLGFSDKRAAQDFCAWLPDIRQSLANSSFTLQEIQVMSA